jgi:MFS family permease
MNATFTEQESLAVITEMIDRARRNVQKGSGTFMIYWGAMVAIAALLNVVLVYVLAHLSISPGYSFHIWWIMAPAWIGSFMLEHKRDKAAIVKSHIDNIISSVWRAFGISNVIFLLMIFGLAYSLQEYSHFFYLINPVILLMTGIGQFVTARACRFRPFLHGAIAMWAGSSASIMLFQYGNGVLVQFIILAACMIIGFVIPGYKLNKLAKENHV